MNVRTLGPFPALHWMKTRGGPLAGLLLLIAVGIVVHRLALVAVGTVTTDVGTTASARAHFVRYIDTHLWIVTPYLAAFVGGLLWMLFRQLPRWSLRLTFWFLALPILGYMWICIRVVVKGLMAD